MAGRSQRVFTEEEKLLILSLYQSGKSTGIISKQFGTSTNRISSILSESGIQFRPSGRKRTRIRKPKMEKIQHIKPEPWKAPERPEDLTIINLLSMPEEYNIKEAERLKQFIKLEIVPNIKFGGITFDLAIPELGMLIVSTPNPEGYDKWRAKIGKDAFVLSDIMREYHYSSLDKLYMGDEILCKEVVRRYKILHSHDKAKIQPK